MDKLKALYNADCAACQVLMTVGFGTCSRRYRRRYRLMLKHGRLLSRARYEALRRT